MSDDPGARGIGAVYVEKDTPGYRVGKHEDKMGIRCVPVVEIHLENCRVPAGNLLGGSEGGGFKQAMKEGEEEPGDGDKLENREGRVIDGEVTQRDKDKV